MTQTESTSLTHRDRRLAESPSEWARQFDCSDMRILIVCRGPVRKEAIDTFREMGAARVGILVSEKDSIVYTNALAPELRFTPPEDVHRVRDYTGATKEEREERIQQIIDICKNDGYEYVFAGYGFMAEDESFVATLEGAGVRFVGPCSFTVRSAGKKDEAKRTALEQDVSVTPGVENLTGRTLLAKAKDIAALRKLAESQGLAVEPSALADDTRVEDAAEAVLEASYAKGLDIISVDEICAQLVVEVTDLFSKHPGRRIRLKAIGGGGGKGQRILAAPADPAEAEAAAATAPDKYREILSEVKAGGVGDNKNVLLELNIEQTRHHEIQLIGNGAWCMALGGRDCSLQMHEQKLLEVSITQDALKAAIEKAKASGDAAKLESLEAELTVLTKMEAEAERFGAAVKLDSASTFECIVEGDRHYFMEVNTRIQVEHRVTELCYGLRFTNPSDPADFFDVESLVEAMALIARNGTALPRPTRLPRFGAAVEARLNATDQALDPSAGGVIEYWSDPIEGEVRDDQGICVKNPDTGQFMRYRLAGAYDSNIALLVSVGGDRRDSYEHLFETLRRTRLSGPELSTNLEFHFGLVAFFLGQDVFAKPTTRFVVPYLTMVGLLKQAANNLDVTHAITAIGNATEERVVAAGLDPAETKKKVRRLQTLKQTLIGRPLKKLLEQPHLFSAWLSTFRGDFEVAGAKVTWKKNPVKVLAETYHLLHMTKEEGLPPSSAIWGHDEELLERGLAVYAEIESRLGLSDWAEVSKALESDTAPSGFDAQLWEKVRAAHQGHQLGLEIFDVLAVLGAEAGFFDIVVNEDLTVTLPERLQDAELQARMKKVLVPPPVASSDEIVAVTGGMFYSREAPDRPPLLGVGSHFEAGQPLYIIEVMKMFNKVNATFSGTVVEVLVENDGKIVKKGEALFKVKPDIEIAERDLEAEAAARHSATEDLLARVLN